MRTRANICIFLLLSVVLTVFSSCEKEDTFHVQLFSVSGIVCDEADMKPVPEIDMVLAAYSLDDLARNDALYTKSCLSSADGSYQLTVKTEDDLSGVYFVLALEDVSETREVKYEPFEQVLYMQKTSQSYSPFTKTYEVTDNDLKLKLSR